ncbi:MAG: OsmC family protein [Thermoflexus sp.]|jgi:uncharacterized OsmC-like protein|nr:OsmC family protein [Thermoflexus sp.]MDT7885039.1 OsmC family protein [Thermoflexus sp.]MDT7948606.1 OsmC family protein [Thermoflexus sp.]
MRLVLNGLDVEQLQQLSAQVQADPEAARSLNRWTARVRWLGGFKGRAYIRNHSFVVDEPADLVGQDEAPNAVEYVLGALGACLTVGFVLNATKRGIPLRNLEIALEGEIDNILTFLGLSQEGHPGYREIIVKAYVDADADEETLRAIWEETVVTSPVGNTLARPVTLRPELRRATAA